MTNFVPASTDTAASLLKTPPAARSSTTPCMPISATGPVVMGRTRHRGQPYRLTASTAAAAMWICRSMPVWTAPGATSTFTYSTSNFTNIKIQKDRVAPTSSDTGFDDLVWYRPDLKNTCCLGSACIPLGFVIDGTWANENISNSDLVFGDVNGDGIPDLIIGAVGGSDNGYVYVVFGTKNGFPDPLYLNTINGTNGFVITGGGITFINSAATV